MLKVGGIENSVFRILSVRFVVRILFSYGIWKSRAQFTLHTPPSTPTYKKYETYKGDSSELIQIELYLTLL
jgi:hypothetical protein